MSSVRKPATRTKRKAAGNVQNGTASKKSKAASSPKKPRKPRGMIQLCEGEVITDLHKKQWRVGDLVSWGGFGAIHYASRDIGAVVGPNAEYVVKIEPHSNGPLFVELSFYMRVAKPDLISDWMKKHHLKHLGIPPYTASGSLEKDGKKYRFMVIDRFADDIDAVFRHHGKQFAINTVLQLGLRIVDCLEYIHSKGFVHADVKGSNLMLGHGPSKEGQVYLVDYGLAFRFNCDDNHKEYKEDPKRRHDGTVEFTSRDAHKGVAPSCRGDLEILGYCMLQWACGRLPWEDNLTDKEYVKTQKIRHMDNIPKLVNDCLKDNRSDELVKFLQLVNQLEYEQVPDYTVIRKIFTDGLKKRGVKDDGKTVTFLSADGGSVSSPVTNVVSDSEPEPSPSPVKKPRTTRVKSADKSPLKKVPKKRTTPKRLQKASPKTSKKVTKSRRKPKVVDFAQSP